MLSNRSTHRFFLFVTLVFALWLRVHQLEQLPAGLHFDEAANAILSSEIAFDSYRPIFITSYTGKETLFFYTAGGVMNRIGPSIFSLRLTAAFFGLLTIAATYRLGLTIFRDRHIALIAAIFLAVNFAHLLFSRLGFRAISQPLTQTLTILFLVEGIQQIQDKRSAGVCFAAAGLFLGLTAHTYLAARLFPVALAIPLICFGIWKLAQRPKPTDLFQTFLYFCITGVVALAVLTPLLYWFMLNPDAFWVRISQVGNTTESISIAEGLRRAALMLFWRGDPYIRFNLPYRPLFFPLMLVPAAVGIWQISPHRKPFSDGERFGRFVLLIIPIVMLLPTALATNEIVPSNLRAIGIFPFVLFWPAAGLVWLVQMVEQLLKRDRRSAASHSTLKNAIVPLYILLLGLSGINVYRDYFSDWGSRPDSFYETEGDIREVANYLNQVDGDRPLVVSTRFVPHPALAFLANSYDQLHLIPESRALVYPAGQPPLAIFPASSPETEWMATLSGTREQFLAQNQNPAFTTLAISQPFPEPQTAVLGNFGFAVQLTGYDLESGKVGERLTLRSYFEVLGNPGFNMIPFVHLEDGLGNRWSQLEQPGYSPQAWQAGDKFVQQFELPLPAGMPPTSDYTLRIGWFDEATGQEVTRFDADGRFAGSAFTIESVSLLPNAHAMPTQAPAQSLNQQVAAGLMLMGIDFDQREYSQGERLNFALWWQADRPQAEIRLVTRLSQANTRIELESVAPAGNSYPFSAWHTPSFVIDQHQMQLPADLPPGDWNLQTHALFADGSSMALFEPILLQIDALDLLMTPPPFEQAIDELFEEQIKLVGYSFDTEKGELELVWQAVNGSAGDYIAFVQVLNDDNSCCTWQADRPLVSSAARPTSRWVAGEYVLDRYQLEDFDANQPIIVGLYRPENGIRLTTSESSDFVELR